MRAMLFAGCLMACSYQPTIANQLGEDAASDGPTNLPIDSAPDAPLVACKPAPDGCTLFECVGVSTSCYYACADTRDWGDARDFCVDQMVGCLATIESLAENTCIFTAMSPIVFPDIVWFGLEQDRDQANPAAGWNWQCGTSAFLAPNWGPGDNPNAEPNDNDGSNPPDETNRENCGAMINNGAWIDGGCNTQSRFVCELPRP